MTVMWGVGRADRYWETMFCISISLQHTSNLPKLPYKLLNFKLVGNTFSSELGCSFLTWIHKASRLNAHVQYGHDILPCVRAVMLLCLFLTIRMQYSFQEIACLLHANTQLLWQRTGFCLSVDVMTFLNYTFTVNCVGQWLWKWWARKLLWYALTRRRL